LVQSAQRGCKLFVDRDGKKIAVASGTIILPVNPDETIHTRPLPHDHAKVTVDEFVPGEEDTPLPVPNDELTTIISVVGSSTAWPMGMIAIDQVKIVCYYYNFLYL